MLGTHDLLLFVMSGLLLNISPGPDTAYIVARSTQLGWKAGLSAALGIGTGVLVHITAAALGISALLAASATAFNLVKLLGAAYLLYLGTRMLLGRSDVSRVAKSVPSATLAQVFRQGFMTNVLNPKVALFFVAFLPQFIDADAPSEIMAFLLLGVIFDFNGTLWNILVAWFSTRAATIIRNIGQFDRWIERALGSLLIYLGIGLAFTQRG